ncbi:MAG: hypothetical protein KF780_09970 [Sphingomonas sp.]|nr:hypothetical protein [Sphingomonas sp.]
MGVLCLSLLAACGEAEAPVENAVPMNIASNAIEGEVTLAERLAREALGNPEALTFADPIRSRSEGVTIICGHYTRGEEPARRYIVVDNQDVFVEANMSQADMDASFAEFCTQGAQRPAQPAAPAPQENAQ